MKLNYKIISFFVILLYLTSCVPNKPPSPSLCLNQDKCFGVWMDYSLELQYKNSSGDDLWNSSNAEHYDIDSIKIYYLAPDGCIVYYFNETVKGLEPDNTFAYMGFAIRENNQGYFFVLDLFGAAYHKHGNKEVMWGIDSDIYSPRTVYIQLNSNDTDTINAEIKHLCGDMLSQNPGNYCKYDVYGEIHYNSNLIVSSWESNMNKMSQGIYPVIVKE